MGIQFEISRFQSVCVCVCARTFELKSQTEFIVNAINTNKWCVYLLCEKKDMIISFVIRLQLPPIKTSFLLIEIEMNDIKDVCKRSVLDEQAKKCHEEMNSHSENKGKKQQQKNHLDYDVMYAMASVCFGCSFVCLRFADHNLYNALALTCKSVTIPPDDVCM